MKQAQLCRQSQTILTKTPASAPLLLTNFVATVLNVVETLKLVFVFKSFVHQGYLRAHILL